MVSENEKRRKIETDVDTDIQTIYMDYNATTPLAPSVISEISDALVTAWGNPSSSYDAGVQAKRLIQNSRENLRCMVNGNNASEIIFTSGGTEANNHVIQNCVKYFEKFVKAKMIFSAGVEPHIITTTIEHDSVLCTLKHLEEEKVIDVTYVKVSKKLGYVDPEEVLQNIRDETVLISIMLANNETGIIQQVGDLCSKLKEHEQMRKEKGLPNVFVHTDAAQAIGKIPVDVKELGVDYLTIVGHKFYGPRIGALWVRAGCPLHPMLHGGSQEMGKRAGTENTCMIAGLGEAAKLVTNNLEEWRQHFENIRSYLRQSLGKTFGEKLQVNDLNCATIPNTLNISLEGNNLQGWRVLGECRYLQASVGAACHTDMGDKPSAILLEHGIPESYARNAIRLSVGRETSKAEVDIVVEDLRQAASCS